MSVESQLPRNLQTIDVRDLQGGAFSYLVERELGSSRATVYLAQRRRLRRGEQTEENLPQVAIKVLGGGIRQKGELVQEAEVLRRVHGARSAPGSGGSTRVVRLGKFDVPLETVDGLNAVLELEYLDGTTLDRWLKRWAAEGPEDPYQRVAEAARIVEELAAALEELHGVVPEAVVHRDVKPQNVMVTADGLKLFDFNIARTVDQRAKMTEIGTPEYMAPEQYSGAYDQRVDLYALGLIAWEVLHGERLSQEERRATERRPVRWPTERFSALEPPLGDLLAGLIPGLLCPAEARLDHPLKVRELAGALGQALAARRRHEAGDAAEQGEGLEGLDMVQLVAELRASGRAAVVVDTELSDGRQRYLRVRMQVEDPLEQMLVGRLRRTLGDPGEPPLLLVLAGNAGDGKSHLIHRLLHARPELAGMLDQVNYIADATHALRPDQSQSQRLAGFFGPFGAGAAGPEQRVHLIAMNTGMVVRFFDEATAGQGEGEGLTPLYRELERQLGLRAGVPTAAGLPFAVEVVNLDLRALLRPAAGGGPSFAERMLDRLDPEQADSLVGPLWERCGACSAGALCPVRFNLRALGQKRVRRALFGVLGRAALDPEIHLSPRNLWGFYYRLISGGLERYEGEPGETPCAVIRRKVEAGEHAWILAGHFSELLFAQQGGGALWEVLRRLDPAFAPAEAIDALHTRLAIVKNLDAAAETVEALGGQGQVLAGCPLDRLLAGLGEGVSPADRRNAAVRRQVFFCPDTLATYLSTGAYGEFEALLAAYAVYSAEGGGAALARQHREALTELGNLVREAFLSAHGLRIGGRQFFRVSQPNLRTSRVLLVRAERTQLNELFRVRDLLQREVHMAAHDGRPELLAALGYRPDLVTLSLCGYRISVDIDLFQFMRQVRRGQQPSAIDLAQFQALRFIGASLGNNLAVSEGRAQPLYVWDPDEGLLHLLEEGEFGDFRVQRLEEVGA